MSNPTARPRPLVVLDRELGEGGERQLHRRSRAAPPAPRRLPPGQIPAACAVFRPAEDLATRATGDRLGRAFKSVGRLSDAIGRTAHHARLPESRATHTARTRAQRSGNAIDALQRARSGRAGPSGHGENDGHRRRLLTRLPSRPDTPRSTRAGYYLASCPTERPTGSRRACATWSWRRACGSGPPPRRRCSMRRAGSTGTTFPPATPTASIAGCRATTSRPPMRPRPSPMPTPSSDSAKVTFLDVPAAVRRVRSAAEQARASDPNIVAVVLFGSLATGGDHAGQRRRCPRPAPARFAARPRPHPRLQPRIRRTGTRRAGLSLDRGRADSAPGGTRPLRARDPGYRHHGGGNDPAVIESIALAPFDPGSLGKPTGEANGPNATRPATTETPAAPAQSSQIG